MKLEVTPTSSEHDCLLSIAHSLDRGVNLHRYGLPGTLKPNLNDSQQRLLFVLAHNLNLPQ